MDTNHTEHPPRGAPEPPPPRRCLRRIGLFFAILIGTGLIVAAVVWLCLPKYKATAYFQVAMSQPTVFFEPTPQNTVEAFDLYKATLAQRVKESNVLTAALQERVLVNEREMKAGQLPCVQRAESWGDPVVWLQEDLEVTFPGNGEIMEVSLAGDDPEQLTALLNVVVDAFQKEVLDAEMMERNARLSTLDAIYVEKSAFLRAKMSELGQLSGVAGIEDYETVKLRQQIALQRLSDARKELYRVQTLLERTRGELKRQQTLCADVGTVPISQVDLESHVASHPLIRQLSADLAEQIEIQASIQAVGGPNTASKHQDKVAEIRTQIAELEREAVRKIQEKTRLDMEMEISRLQADVEILAGVERRLEEEVAQQEKALLQRTPPSVDLRIMQEEIERLKKVVGSVLEERERLRIESQADRRTRLVERAKVSPWQLNW